jgi:polyhydroxyalkanoate synthesis regulator protein
MPGDYSCFLCSKTIFHSAKQKHLFSKRHLSEIQNAILRTRGTIERWIAEYDQGKKSHLRDFLPPISLSGKSKYHIVCIPCKHIGETIKGHVCSEENMKQNVQYFKNALKQTFVPEAKAPPSVPISPLPPVNSGEIEKLNKEIAKLKDELFDADGKNEMADQFLDALKFWIRFVKSENQELYGTIMDNFKEEGYGSILECLGLP